MVENNETSYYLQKLSPKEVESDANELAELFKERFKNSVIKKSGGAIIPIDEYRESIKSGREIEPTEYVYLGKGQQSWSVDFSHENLIELQRWNNKDDGWYGKSRLIDQVNLESVIIRAGESSSVGYNFEPKEKKIKNYS